MTDASGTGFQPVSPFREASNSHGEAHASSHNSHSSHGLEAHATCAGIVHVVDDDTKLLKSLTALLRSAHLSVSAYSAADDLLKACRPTHRGCVITDQRMPGMTGLELQIELLKRGINMPVIVLTAFANTPTIVTAMKNGAVTLLEKPYREEELFSAVRDALERDQRQSLEQHAFQERQRRLQSLSPKEREVLDLMLRGVTNKNMSRRLRVSLRTIESRRQSIFAKMGRESLAELVRDVVECERDTKTSELGPVSP